VVARNTQGPEFKTQYCHLKKREFYKCFPEDEYTKLKSYACGLVSVFRSTYPLD
jgi:hypothetical protein